MWPSHQHADPPAIPRRGTQVTGISRVRWALIAQAAALIAAGLVVITVGLAAPQRQPTPSPGRTWRPATEQENQERDRQILIEELDRLRATPDAPR